MMNWTRTVLCASAFVVLTAVQPGGAAPRAEVADRIVVEPAAVRLDGRRAARQIVVTGLFHGEARDVTASARLAVGTAGTVIVRGTRMLARADGHCAVIVRAAGRTATVPVVVSNCGRPDPIRFTGEVLPVLTKQGCATGSCHGSPHGKGGFSLSLYGYDPKIDRVSLTRDGYNRRVNVMEPGESLLLKKPSLQIPHVGGRRLRRTDAAYPILQRWIYEGANTDLSGASCERIEVYPATGRILRATGRQQQLSVLAYYSDGTTRDVTDIATYASSHPSVASVDAGGLVLGGSRGQSAVSVRYLDKVRSVPIMMVEEVPGFRWRDPGENNAIDSLVNARLRALRYDASPVCTDTAFLRRIYLDLTGLLPTADEARMFLQDRSADRRARLIDRLLGNEEYARFWALKKADLMRVSPRRLKDGRAEAFARWIVDAVRANMPCDQFAREILTSSGDTERVAAANYFLAIPTMEERTEMTAQLFMGTRVECAKCHNHPFENWTMRDYYRIAAVFARTQVDKGRVQLASAGEAMHPTTHERMAPWGAPERAPEPPDRRAAFAAWLTAPENPFFSRVEANRIWADLMGRGIVDPVDDFRSSNPPANGPLLDMLARELTRSGYDRKHLIRLICNSRTYQRSSQPDRFNAADEQLFSHARIRLLSAEQLKDAIGAATRTLEPASSVPARARELEGQVAARQRTTTDPKDAALRAVKERLTRLEAREDYATQRLYPEESGFTRTFGQPTRETACACERQSAPTLLQALELLNGGTAYGLVQQGSERYAGMADGQLVEELYLSALSRLPIARERDAAMRYLSRAADRKAAVTDLVWTVINTREFLFQH